MQIIYTVQIVINCNTCGSQMVYHACYTTLLFPRAAAIVTDVGAPLSHAAIVARELGIPAVVGCGNATMRLNDGDRVLVDGGQGVVMILNDEGYMMDGPINI